MWQSGSRLVVPSSCVITCHLSLASSCLFRCFPRHTEYLSSALLVPLSLLTHWKPFSNELLIPSCHLSVLFVHLVVAINLCFLSLSCPLCPFLLTSPPHVSLVLRPVVRVRRLQQRVARTPSAARGAPACPASTGTPRRPSPRCSSESPTGARVTPCPPRVCGWEPAWAWWCSSPCPFPLTRRRGWRRRSPLAPVVSTRVSSEVLWPYWFLVNVVGGIISFLVGTGVLVLSVRSQILTLMCSGWRTRDDSFTTPPASWLNRSHVSEPTNQKLKGHRLRQIQQITVLKRLM